MLGVVLFAGRWIAGLLSDRWWAEGMSPAAVSFVTGWHLLRLTLEIGGVLVASAWFIGHLLVVYRAVGSVQVSRHVANLEFREALTPELLVTGTIAAGLLLGLLTGAGASEWASSVALAWHGLAYDFREPVLGHDLGLYVAQLPLWRLLHGFALLLAVLGLVVCLALYGLVGAVRWVDGRPAINDHARAHVGWLLVALALALAWGYLLEPYELVAGISGVPDRPTVELTALVSPALTGTALMVALMSAVWAARPRHALVAAGWLVLIITSLGGHYLLPAFNRDLGSPTVEPGLARQLGGYAFGVHSLHDSTDSRTLRDASPPRLPALWNERAVRLALPADTLDPPPASPAVLSLDGRRLPVWLVVRGQAGGRVGLSAIAADRTTSAGDPLYYRLGDTVGYPSAYTLLDISPHAVRPGAPAYDLHPQAHGTPVADWAKRLVLAWSQQVGQLLGAVPDSARLAWRLTPTERLEALMPFADWGRATARIIDGELVWICDGYVTSTTFPLMDRVPWRHDAVNSVRAGFLGVVRAESGQTQLYLRPDADPLAEAWASVAAGVVRSSSEIPRAVTLAAPYPAELFEAQALALERGPWEAGALSGRPEGGSGPGDPARPEPSWRTDTAGTRLITVYERPIGRQVSAVLVGTVREGRPQLELVRVDSAVSLPAPRILDATWGRFPSFERLADSVRSSGVRVDSLIRGPLSIWRDDGSLGALRTYFAPRAGGGLALVWVSVAQGKRVGAGRTLEDAWHNLSGTSTPLSSSGSPAILDEARRWIRTADSALRAGDWASFGRAFDALKETLGAGRDSVPR